MATTMSAQPATTMALPQSGDGQLRMKTISNLLMELRKICQHPYLAVPALENLTLSDEEQQRRLIQGSGKLLFLKLLLPKLKERGHRVLLFSQFKIALDRIEDFLIGEGTKYLRLDGDVQQAVRQKSMDAFNAPNSDYFVFLLTTRAGGVGINLATADTVIVYDPDFNPHQDLQAIARSHRYGQRKPVLVFKLMTQDSVEEQIVFKGKKKMVLDHLVVQNLNSAEDDVDIENIITHGAKALYEKEGKEQKGISYNSKNVDEMIDQVEKQAVEEAKVLEEKWRLEDEAAARGEQKEASKEARTFGFAKIWEADQAGLKDMDDQAEQVEMDQDVVDLLLTRKAQTDALEAEEGLKKRARQKKLQLESGVYLDGDGGGTPEKKKGKGRGKGKGKGKASGNVSSDAEFAPPDDIVASDSDENSAGEAEGLLDDMGRPIIVGGMVGEQHGGRAGKKAARERAESNARLTKKGDGTPSIPPPAGTQPTTPSIPPPSGTQPIPKPTLEEKKAKREMKKLKAMQERARIMNGLVSSQQSALASAAQQPPPPPTAQQQRPAGPSPADGPARILAMTLHHDAQETLQWLYHILREFHSGKELNIWARLAIPEAPISDRRVYYDYLAERADNGLKVLGHAPYFTTPKPRTAVMKLIESKLAAVPAEAMFRKGEAMLDIPNTAGPSTARPQVQSRSSGNDEALAVPKESTQNRTVSPIPAPIPRSLEPTPVQPSRPIATPVAGPSALRPAPARSLHLSSNGSPSVASPRNSAPVTVIPTATSSSAIARPAGGVPVCPVCQEPGHGFKECNERPPLHVLLEIQTSMVANEGLEGMASSPYSARWSKLEEDLIRQAEALDKVNNMIRLYRESEAAPAQLEAGPSAKRPRSRTSRPKNTMNGNGTKHEVIVIDDDSDPEEAANRRSSQSKKVKHEPVSPNRRGRPSHVPHCPICGEVRYHIAATCPVVQAGAASIRAAISNFAPSDPLYNVLAQLCRDRLAKEQVQAQPVLCAFCQKQCGNPDVRACAEKNGGRPALKAAIRRMNLDLDLGVRDDERSNRLYEAYQSWPK